MIVNWKINEEHDFGSGAITEPVTLAEVKDYLRLQGFTSDESGEQEFDFDDSLLEDMISEGREWVEKYTGQYLVSRTLTIVLLNQAGYFELPGPKTGDLTLYDEDDVEIDTDNYTIIGTTYPKIKTCFDDQITAIYEAGETSAWGQNAIKAYVAWAYENRGDEAAGSPERAAAICRPHRKLRSWG